MSTGFTSLCLWVAGMVSGFLLSGIISHSGSPAKKEQPIWQYGVALFMPLLCVGILVLLMAFFAEVLAQVDLSGVAKSAVDYVVSMFNE